MGSIDRDLAGNLEVRVEDDIDAAQLRVAIKASDGADERDVKAEKTLTFSAENPFNFIALWSTDFVWTLEAMEVALDCLVPVAQSSLHLQTRSHKKMLRRMTQEMTPGFPKQPDDSPR
jgi:hypothetical protein